MRTLSHLALLLLPSLALAAPTVRPPSRIDEVTVFRSSARVTRVAKVELPDGAARVVLEGLPDGLDDDSIRVQGKGSAKARLFGVTVERITAELAGAAEARAVEERIEALGDEDHALEDRIAAARARAKLIESLRSTYSEERAKNLALRDVSTKQWAELVTFADAEYLRASGDLRKAETARRDLARRIAQARADLEKVQAKRARTTKSIAVEVEADRGGAFELTIAYAVPAAGWQPIWDARLAPETATMELSFLGSVWQSSGEDWSDVRLAVSTAQPARGLYVPELQPVFLTRAQPPPQLRKYRRAPESAAAPSMAMQDAPQATPEAESLGFSMESPVAQVEDGLLASTFTAPRRETVDGSGQARKVNLARFPLHATLVRTAAPRVEPAAYLTAKATNETGFPLVAGVAGVYVGDDFAGRAPLKFTPAGGEIELAFGQDERIEIDRKLLERKRETEGLISKDEVYRYRVRVAVKNRYAAPVSVKLLDLVPVSRDEKIKVEILEGTTAATREDPERPGVRVYELELGAREERVVELRYVVRYPRGFPVAGLE
jgi:uncharacterized protein (TIGR02231 family)